MMRLKVKGKESEYFVPHDHQPTPKMLQGRQVESNFSTESAYKVAKVGLAVLGIAALVYLSVCNPNEHSFCIPKDLTTIALNLDKVASLF